MGSTIQLDGINRTVVGVLQPRTTIPFASRLFRPDVWVPRRFSADELSERRSNFLNVMGRLKPGASLRLAPLVAESTRGIRSPLLMLLGAVGLLMLIASANVASLLLARAGRGAGRCEKRALGAQAGTHAECSVAAGHRSCRLHQHESFYFRSLLSTSDRPGRRCARRPPLFIQQIYLQFNHLEQETDLEVAGTCLYSSTAHRGHEVSTPPEVLTCEVPLATQKLPRAVDRTLSLDLSNHLRYCVLRGNRDHHVRMVRHQGPFLDPALAPIDTAA